MKKVTRKTFFEITIIVFMCTFFVGLTSAQMPQTFCGLDEILRRNTPINNEIDQGTLKDLGKETSNLRNGPVIYINIVVHILYNTPDQDFTDEEIIDLVDEVNKIYRKDIDTTQILPILRQFADDAKIQFCLAKTDPDGNPTNGINHVGTDEYSFPFSFTDTTYLETEQIKIDSLGGATPWNTDMYLNIWIGTMGEENEYINYGVPQSTYLPLGEEVPIGIPGIVLDQGLLELDLSFLPVEGIFAHELGHALGLKHTHGDPISMETFCDYDDKIDDTPLCGFIVNSCNSEGINSCIEAENDLVDNLSNIMSYNCLIMITKMQAERMYENVTNLGPQGYVLTESECNSTTNIAEIGNEDLQFEIFPNPNQGNFNVLITTPFYDPIQLSLLDMGGRELINKVITPKFQHNEQWDLSEISNGIYLIRLKIRDSIITKKVVVCN